MKKKTLVLICALAMLFALAVGATPVSADEAVRPQLTIGRFGTAPTIDGSFSEAEWGAKSFTLAEGQANVTAHKEKSGDEELPLTKTVSDVYLGYDDSHFYMCVVADYNPHEAQALLGSKLWSDDCIQTKIAATPDGPNYNDIDFGLNTTTNRALAHVWNGHGVTYGQLAPGKGKDFMITRTGNKTVYEVSYPLKSFASNTVKLKEGDKLAFSIAQHMSNKGGFYEYAGGIVNSKEITSAAILTLGAAKNLPSSGKTGSTGSTGSKSSGTTGKSKDNKTESTSGTTSEKVDSNDDSSDTETTESGENAPTDSNTDTSEVAEQVVEEVVEEEAPSSGIPLGAVIAIIAGLVVLLGVAFYFLILRKH